MSEKVEKTPHPDIQQLSGSSGFGGTLIVTTPFFAFASFPLPSGPEVVTGVLSREEANVMAWGFGAVVVVGKAVGVEWEVCFWSIIGEAEEAGGGDVGGGEAPCGWAEGAAGCCGRPR